MKKNAKNLIKKIQEACEECSKGKPVKIKGIILDVGGEEVISTLGCPVEGCPPPECPDPNNPICG